MTKLVTDLQGQVEKQQEEIKESVGKKLEEEKAKIQHKVNTELNENLEKLDKTKTEEKFKFKASGAAIGRIAEIRPLVRAALTEGSADFVDFETSRTHELLSEILKTLDKQEGLVRLAERSRHGYRLVDKIQEEDRSGGYLTDPDLLRKIKLAEKELDKDEEGEKREVARARKRGRSRSPAREEKKSPARRRDGFQCHWCGGQGHS